MINSTDKKSLLYLTIIIIVFLLALSLIWYLFQVSKLETKISVPLQKPKKELTTKELLEKLTPAEPHQFTPEEKKELNNLLKKMTPKKTKPSTPKE